MLYRCLGVYTFRHHHGLQHHGIVEAIAAHDVDQARHLETIMAAMTADGITPST